LPVRAAGTPLPRHAVERARNAARRWKHRPLTGGNVIALPPRAASTAPFDRLTASLVMAQFRAGTLHENVLLALPANAGLAP
jgi:hypothetical protein